MALTWDVPKRPSTGQRSNSTIRRVVASRFETGQCIGIVSVERSPWPPHRVQDLPNAPTRALAALRPAAWRAPDRCCPKSEPSRCPRSFSISGPTEFASHALGPALFCHTFRHLQLPRGPVLQARAQSEDAVSVVGHPLGATITVARNPRSPAAYGLCGGRELPLSSSRCCLAQRQQTRAGPVGIQTMGIP